MKIDMDGFYICDFCGTPVPEGASCINPPCVRFINRLVQEIEQKQQYRKAKIIHVRDQQPGDVYIGRPSKWGNPFVIGPDGTRSQVIKKYREYILSQPTLIASLPELRGKRLACYCAPKACHGDVLIELLFREQGSDGEVDERG